VVLLVRGAALAQSDSSGGTLQITGATISLSNPGSGSLYGGTISLVPGDPLLINSGGVGTTFLGGTLQLNNPGGGTGSPVLTLGGAPQLFVVGGTPGDPSGGVNIPVLTIGGDPQGVIVGTPGDIIITFGNFAGTVSTLVASGVGNAQVEGHALIGGGQTVTNDINNHLFGLRAGGGEEHSLGSAMDDGVVMGQGDGPESPIVKLVPRTRQWEVFSTLNYGNVRVSPINSQSGVRIDSWAPGIGIERHLSRGFTLGFAASFLSSHQSYTGGLGVVHLEGPALSSYLSYVRSSFWSDVLYSFGTYDMSSTRNPGGGVPLASGNTSTYTNAVQFNTGWNFRFQNNTLVTGPFVGVDYLHGAIQSYTENGGGGFGALSYGHQTYQSLVSRVGWSVSKKLQTDWAAITPQLRLSYERQNLQNNGTSLTLVNLPISSQTGHQSPGQDYMVAGTGVNFEFSPAFNLMLTYQTQIFRNHMQANFGGLRFGYKF
jgi:uncharacterized protein YhjY with autotransporter beta-barrel domain